MNITLIEASNYFKGLLLLIGKDRKISEPEADLVKRIGKHFGFEKEFCENAIRDILENEFIIDSPPVFPNPALAKKFIKDGLIVAASDGEIHPFEEEWLKATAEINNVDEEWFVRQKNQTLHNTEQASRLEADGLKVK